MKEINIESLMKEVNKEFEDSFKGGAKSFILDVELSGHSPTCKCMRSASSIGDVYT